MTRSTTSFHFPDVKVWLALSQAHRHHRRASAWFDRLPDSARLCFCRVTQLGLLCLLTTEQIMKDEVLTQVQAWQVYDNWLEDDRIRFVEGPPGLETSFRSICRISRVAPKDWADSYLIAFAPQAGFQTFDRAISNKARNAFRLAEHGNRPTYISDVRAQRLRSVAHTPNLPVGPGFSFPAGCHCS